MILCLLRAARRWLRRLVDWLRCVDRADDAAFEADTALLAAIRAGRELGIVADPPAWLDGPAVEPDYTGHQWPGQTAPGAIADWLRFSWPDAWWETDLAELLEIAEQLHGIRSRVLFGRLVS